MATTATTKNRINKMDRNLPYFNFQKVTLLILTLNSIVAVNIIIIIIIIITIITITIIMQYLSPFHEVDLIWVRLDHIWWLQN